MFIVPFCIQITNSGGICQGIDRIYFYLFEIIYLRLIDEMIDGLCQKNFGLFYLAVYLEKLTD